MREDGFPGQFKKLEDKIRELAETCHSLQRAKSELEGKICDLEEALKVAMTVEQKYLERKSVIQLKIDDLLSRLDQAVGYK